MLQLGVCRSEGGDSIGMSISSPASMLAAAPGLRPVSAPLACGQLGVRAPTRYGRKVTPPQPGGSAAAKRLSSAWLRLNASHTCKPQEIGGHTVLGARRVQPDRQCLTESSIASACRSLAWVRALARLLPSVSCTG